MITQGTFAYLPEFDDAEIEAQVRYALRNGWSVSIEFTDDPHPRNTFWEMWGLPAFGVTDAADVMREVRSCREAFPNHYVKINAFDNRTRRETLALSFIVQRPGQEPGFRLERQHRPGRTLRYTLHSYATDRPHGDRYA